MINVRYVHPARLLTKQQTECLTSRYTPVIPLADLTEVVEGLKRIQKLAKQDHTGPLDPFGDLIRIEDVAQRLLAQLEAHRKEGA